MVLQMVVLIAVGNDIIIVPREIRFASALTVVNVPELIFEACS